MYGASVRVTKSENDSSRSLRLRSKKNRYRRPPLASGCGGQPLEQGCLAAAGAADDEHVPAVRRQAREELAGVPGRGHLHLPGLRIGGQQVTLDRYGRGVQRRVQPGHVGDVTAAVCEDIHETAVGHGLAVRPAAAAGSVAVVGVEDQEPGEPGQPGPQQRPAGCRQRPG